MKQKGGDRRKVMIVVDEEVEVHYDWNESNGIEEQKEKKEETEKEERKKKKIKKEVKERERKEEENTEEKEEQVKEEKEGERKKKKIKKKGNKERERKIFLIVAVVAVLFIAAVFIFTLDENGDEERISQDVAAIVNGEIITAEELDAEYDKLTEQEKSLVSKEFLLNALIDNELLLQKADEENIVINEQEIDVEINRIKAQFTSEELFNQFLERQGITLEKLREIAEDQLKIKKVLSQDAFSDIKITDSEIEKYYEQENKQFQAKEGEIRATHILVNSSEEAEKILKELEEGADFNELARQYSIGPSAVNGGELGFFGKGVMVKEFEDAAFALEIGEISGVVETEYGYHIIKREPDTIPLEYVEQQIRQALIFSKQRAIYATYMDQLRAQSNVKAYYGNYGTDEIPPDIEISIEEDNFKETKDAVCEEDVKPIVRLFSTTTCPHCNWIKETFDDVVKGYGDQIKAYHWQLDTGDDTLTLEVETKIPKEELEVFKKYNPDYTVPTFVFGCKYYRIGNAYTDLENEKKEMKKNIEKLL